MTSESETKPEAQAATKPEAQAETKPGPTAASPTQQRVALVTGASRGIGRAIALALAADGLKVVLNYTANETAAAEVLAAIQSASPGADARLCRFDVARADETDEAIKAIVAEYGRLDVIVNNAGIAIDGLLLRLREQDWQRVLDVNLTGTMHVCRAAARHLLKAREGGRIVNLTSVVGETGNPGQASYVAAKAGVIGFTRSLARELASRGVTVNAVSPGFIDTDMTAAHVVGEAREALIKQIPLGRIGRPEDVAEAVRFLVRAESGYITGQVLRVNGGLLL
jgi:3-oxoacyl-[acyl-carrier protein] reductase